MEVRTTYNEASNLYPKQTTVVLDKIKKSKSKKLDRTLKPSDFEWFYYVIECFTPEDFINPSLKRAVNDNIAIYLRAKKRDLNLCWTAFDWPIKVITSQSFIEDEKFKHRSLEQVPNKVYQTYKQRIGQ